MTPTTRDSAIAQAIAALETARAHMQFELDELPAHHPTLPSAIGTVRAALASLRSLAPAPADDDDPTASKEWNEGADFVMMALCAHLGVDPKKVQWDAATETVEGDIGSVIGNIFTVKFGEDWSPNAPADQSDAGRDGRIEECAWLIRYEDVDKQDEIFTSDSAAEIALKRFNQAQDGGWNCILFKGIAGPTRLDPVAADIRRALKSAAPAETVGRGEDAKWRCPVNADGPSNCGWPQCADDCKQSNAFLAAWAIEQGKKKFNAETVAMLTQISRALALPAADREAIREALKEALPIVEKGSIRPFAAQSAARKRDARDAEESRENRPR